jgi:hypothetical protein
MDNWQKTGFFSGDTPMSKKSHDVTEELLESLLSNYQKPEDLLVDTGLLKMAENQRSAE